MDGTFISDPAPELCVLRWVPSPFRATGFLFEKTKATLLSCPSYGEKAHVITRGTVSEMLQSPRGYGRPGAQLRRGPIHEKVSAWGTVVTLSSQGFTGKYFSGGMNWPRDISECLSLWQWQQHSPSLLLYFSEISFFSVYKFWWIEASALGCQNQRESKTFWFHEKYLFLGFALELGWK